MRIRILPYRQGSRGAKALAEALGGKVLKLVNSSFKPKLGDLIINWGNTSGYPPGVHGFMNQPICHFINDPDDIRNASNKLKFFELVKDLGLTPRFWTNVEDIPDDAFPIVCRTVLSGHSGDGIVIANSRSDLVSAPLYVQYVKKKDEYRVHLGRSSDTDTTIIAVQRKAKRNDVPSDSVNWQIRNHHNGFIYKRDGVNPPPSVVDAARRCFVETGLDFGAVDVIWNAQKEQAYVLEINTAPGIEGQTVTDYAEFFRSMVS
jgi:hypothetical protein